MPNIINVLNSDGKTSLAREARNEVEQPTIVFNMEYNDKGGVGIVELIIRNISTNNFALNVQVSTTQEPTDPETGNVLQQTWDFKSLGSTTWKNSWKSEIIIPSIPPGQFVNVRTRAIAPATSNPVSHRGGIQVKYLRSSA
jgi:hypothetical protein